MGLPLLLAAGCAARPPVADPGAATAVVVSDAPALESGGGGTGLAPTPASLGSPPAMVPTPSLLDVRTPDLLARFGEPGQRRRDGGAEIWVYDTRGACRLNLVLQRERGGQKVVHAQARMQGASGEQDCLRRLDRRR